MHTDLNNYGWDKFFDKSKELSTQPTLEHGRVISVHKLHYDVILKNGLVTCDILGTIQFQKNPLDIPAVGDWVLVGWHADTPVIHELLTRKTLLKRQKKHDTFPKPIAANVDIAVVIQSARGDFNISRLERILVHIQGADLYPIIIINKIDLVSDEDLSSIKNKVSDLNVHVFYTSTKKPESLDEFVHFLGKGKTVVFIGSSGVGKSSLLNIIHGKEIQKTQAIMEKTGKGKHTTTARTLFKTKQGFLIIDTPGTREFGMNAEDNSAIEESFEDITELINKCRFSDCNHGNEPGCLIKEALRTEKLDSKKFSRYLELIQENNQSAKQMRQSEKKSSKMQSTPQPIRSTRRGKIAKKK
jgi:ribosome biogenesis GTPase